MYFFRNPNVNALRFVVLDLNLAPFCSTFRYLHGSIKIDLVVKG